MIRPAESADIPAILALWNPYIRDTLVTFSSEEKTPESLAALMATRRAVGQEFFLAVEDRLLGFVTYAQFRGGNGYAQAMEHTIILAADVAGKGVGRALMAHLENHARAGGVHTLLAGVSAGNPAGVAFHERVGFSVIARIPEVGRKFGQWWDLILMQKIL
ncbi:MAG: N-acetyltransferase family protein [Albidovulum sp.]